MPPNIIKTYRLTRIAPTPSGYLHLGNVLSFALTVGLAKKTGARVLLRIDDLDRERADPRYIADIFDTLHFLEIPWDEGPADALAFERDWSQVHRMPLYEQALKALKDHLYACNCSRSDIARISPDGAYPGTCRDLHLPLDGENVNWRFRADPGVMKDFVIRKKDGFPAYQLTSIIDDAHFGVDLVVRGEDLRLSTEIQLYLSGFLPGDPLRNTTFYHHPLLLDEENRKLSKSEGATSIQFLRKAGKTRADVYALLAGHLGIKTEVTNLDTLTDTIHFMSGGADTGKTNSLRVDL